MAVSILERPQGVKLGECVSGTIDEDYSGYATVHRTSHGLTGGDYVYVTSDVEDYNGFWPVEIIDGHQFFLLQYPDGPRVAYVVDADITFCYQESLHAWSCVHLPIVYRLSSNLWPTNSVDTARTVSSFTDDNGYINLNLSGALKGSVYDMDWVKISGATNEDLNGVFQIKDAVSTSDVTIDLVYSAAYSFSGATVQYYYKNYHVNVRVYGGLDASHPLQPFKPYERLASLSFIPDSDGEVKFSINEILKSQINGKNNLQLATLPNNLDAFTQFYISYGEGYDQSDGTDITAYSSDYLSDIPVDGWSTEVIDTLDLWLENGTGEEWTDTATPSVSITSGAGGGTNQSENKYVDFAFVAGTDYRINYSFTYARTGGSTALTRRMNIQIMDSGGTVLLSQGVTFTGTGETRTGSYEFEAPTGAARISIYANQVSAVLSSTSSYQINSITVDSGGASGFSGYALNAQLPFKNQYAGSLSAYIDAGWLTLFDSPVSFEDQYFDLSAIVNQSGAVDVIINDVLTSSYASKGPGVYRIPIAYTGSDQRVKLQILSEDITDEITVTANTACANQSLYLTWLNYLGGFDYWDFTAQKEHGIEIIETVETNKNLFPEWPKSYAAYADTIRKEVSRTSRQTITVRSQFMTLAQLEAVKYIKTSPLVQVLISKSDRRTVIVDKDSFRVYDEGDKLYSISFNISYTNLIPSQTV